MSKRSSYMLGKNIFIKVVSLSSDQGVRLARALITDGELPPFIANEFLINHFISRKDRMILNDLNAFPVNNSLLTPNTQVLVSSKTYDLDYFNKYRDQSYSNAVDNLLDEFSTMDVYLPNLRQAASRGKTIRTALIISETVTGNYDDFLKKYLGSDNYNKLVLDSLIHISYLYHVYQNRYQCVHGDPKIHNYTWLELENPIDIEYDFRDQYNSNNSRIIRRRGVKHLFYLTDLEFVFSAIPKTINIDNDTYYYNFYTKIPPYENDNNDDKVYVPKITDLSPYEYNTNLYGGYSYQPNQIDASYSEFEEHTVFDWYNPNFPRLFSIDILTLVKMLLTYWYADSFDGDILRKLNIYFTQFVALSFMEENIHRRDEASYLRVSPATFAELLSS